VSKDSLFEGSEGAGLVDWDCGSGTGIGMDGVFTEASRLASAIDDTMDAREEARELAFEPAFDGAFDMGF